VTTTTGMKEITLSRGTIIISTIVTYFISDRLIQWPIYVRRRRVIQLTVKTRVTTTVLPPRSCTMYRSRVEDFIRINRE
jgi:hypothetical protein